MTYHHIWLTKCNGEDCERGHIENTPVDPEGWATDGTQHLCDECVAKKAEQEKSEQEDAVAS